MQLHSGTRATSVALLLESLFLAVAFASDDHSNMAEEMDSMGSSPTAGLNRPAISLSLQTTPPSYFGYPTGSGFLYAHVFLMVIGWMFLLPVGTLFVSASLSGVAGC
jgi:hypothetical protein